MLGNARRKKNVLNQHICLATSWSDLTPKKTLPLHHNPCIANGTRRWKPLTAKVNKKIQTRHRDRYHHKSSFWICVCMHLQEGKQPRQQTQRFYRSSWSRSCHSQRRRARFGKGDGCSIWIFLHLAQLPFIHVTCLHKGCWRWLQHS